MFPRGLTAALAALSVSVRVGVGSGLGETQADGHSGEERGGGGAEMLCSHSGECQPQVTDNKARHLERATLIRQE